MAMPDAPRGPRRDSSSTGPGTIPMIPTEAVERALREAFQAVSTPAAATPSAAPSPSPSTAPDIPPPPAAAPGGRLRDLVGTDGTLDIEAVYRLGRVPDARLSADLLWRALASLPEDAPEPARRAAFRATVVALLGPAGVGPETVVSDARLRCLRLKQYLTGLEAELNADRERAEAVIQQLEETLTARRAEVALLNATLEAARRSCAERTTALEDITRLLTEEPGAAAPESSPARSESEEETPSYLREDSVRSLLGLPDGPTPKVT